MKNLRRSGTGGPAWGVAVLLLVTGCVAQRAPQGAADEPAAPRRGAESVRFAVFNTSLSRPGPGELAAALARPGDVKASAVAEVLQRVRPDVVLLGEFDFDDTGRSADDFRRNYLHTPQHGAEPIDYPYAFAPRVNTGEPSGVDLDNDGKVGGPADAFGWGDHPGHYGMLVLSRYPLDPTLARSFRLLRWADLPGPAIPADAYRTEALGVLRLSSKTHLDLPVALPVNPDPLDHAASQHGPAETVTVHLLLSHPTPPVFDGPEDRNGRRNHDEVRFWVDYLDGELFLDDAGVVAAFPDEASFVLLGDLNADPFDGDSFGDATNRLIGHRRVNRRFTPASDGALRAADADAGVNAAHRGYPGHDTGNFADFPPHGPGNLRVDYALPSRDLAMTAAGVFWPTPDHPLARLAGASDHHLVWIDVTPGAVRIPAPAPDRTTPDQPAQ